MDLLDRLADLDYKIDEGNYWKDNLNELMDHYNCLYLNELVDRAPEYEIRAIIFDGLHFLNTKLAN